MSKCGRDGGGGGLLLLLSRPAMNAVHMAKEDLRGAAHMLVCMLMHMCHMTSN